MFHNALVILVTYQAAEQAGMERAAHGDDRAGLFILPFFLFSATAGRFADSFDKAMLIRR